MAMCVEDRISSFPDHILFHILSFLPIKDAVRTSIISTKWRYLFASISTIKFDGSLMSGLTDRNVDSFKNFVDRLLKFPDQVSLDCFRLNDNVSWNDKEHDFDVSGWICAALCRGVKEIDLDLKNLGDTLPALLFTCHSLVTLKLDAVDSEIKVPSDVCLGNLKTLQLRNSVLFGDSIHRLISNCHVLEDLAFIECGFDISEVNIQSPSLKRLVLEFDVTEGRYFNYVVVINAPILVYFQYHAAVAASYTLSTMKSLEKADISIYQFDSINSETSATHLIQGICNVRSLSLTTDAAIFLTSGLPIFHNLIEFKYLGVGFNGRETWLVEFLHCVPNLKTLTLNFPDDAGTRWKALRMKVPSCLSFHLKEIEISYFDPRMIEMVSYFLDNAMVLEKLKISTAALTWSQKWGAQIKLLQLLKRSKKSLIVIL
ncbi:F-box/LRR-repeat protein At3g59190 isoform X1 [Gossypium hirsutum]|uniref:F-box/LRR-repeat protein At3g59190 isoform X1 n=1 Tax=Gossypium hirsutum TaxID=3635 RepID=A0A1U8J2V9_GOSHI|nr:F-box/LRR-repeat protein At3g59190 isoform X1 [Gossypium hirsutum]